MTHADEVLDAERFATTDLVMWWKAIRSKNDQANRFRAYALRSLQQAKDMRADTCPTCGGTGKSAMQVAPGARGVVFGLCPAGCKAGAKP